MIRFVRRETGAEVVVVGAGITGLSVAFFLADRGIDTLVLERKGVASEASGVQPGGVRQQWGTRVNCLLAREALAFYRNLRDELRVPVDARLDACGYLFVAHSDARLAELRANVTLQNELGIASAIVTPTDAADLVPGLDVSSVVGAAWNGEDGYFDRPQTVVEAFAAAATGRGAKIEIRDVRRIEPETPKGRWRLATDLATVEADAVVVATGCATATLLTPLEVSVAIEPEARHLFLSPPIRERLLEPLVVSTERRIAAKQLSSGRVLASDLTASGDPTTQADTWRRRLAHAIDELLPILRYVSYPVLTSGLYDLTPDSQPLVGEAPDRPGLWLAAGFSGHGFMLAPAVSRRLAAAIAGDGVDDLLRPFAPDRFELGAREVERQVF
jgi:glycine/D-amino acid oxidase-like deaminating enzyme